MIAIARGLATISLVLLPWGVAAGEQCAPYLGFLGFVATSPESVVARVRPVLGRVYPTDDATRHTGTAVVLRHSHGVAVTASHAVHGAEEESGRRFVHLVFPGLDERGVRAEVVREIEAANESAGSVATDQARDLAFLLFDEPLLADHGVELAAGGIDRSKELHYFGFPGQHQHPLDDVARPSGSGQGNCTLGFDARTTPGDSGGPAIDSSGALVGVVIQSEVGDTQGRFVPAHCFADELVRELRKALSGDDRRALATRALRALDLARLPAVSMEFRPAETTGPRFSNIELMMLIEDIVLRPERHLAFEPYLVCPIQQAALDRGLGFDATEGLWQVRSRMSAIQKKSDDRTSSGDGTTGVVDPEDAPEATPGSAGGTGPGMSEGLEDDPWDASTDDIWPGTRDESLTRGFASPASQAAYARQMRTFLSSATPYLSSTERQGRLIHVEENLRAALGGLRGAHTIASITGEGIRPHAVELTEALRDLASVQLELASLEVPYESRDDQLHYAESALRLAAEAVKVASASQLGGLSTEAQQLQATAIEVVEASDPEADVQIEEESETQINVTEAEPQVEVEQAEAEIDIQEEGKTDVRVVDQAAVAELETEGYIVSSEPEETDELRTQRIESFGAYADMTVDDLVGTDVVAADGEEVGEIDNVALIGDRLVAIVAIGGFLGIGEHDVALPLERLAMDGESLVADGLTAERFKNFPAYDEAQAEFVPTDGRIGDFYE